MLCILSKFQPLGLALAMKITGHGFENAGLGPVPAYFKSDNLHHKTSIRYIQRRQSTTSQCSTWKYAACNQTFTECKFRSTCIAGSFVRI